LVGGSSPSRTTLSCRRSKLPSLFSRFPVSCASRVAFCSKQMPFFRQPSLSSSEKYRLALNSARPTHIRFKRAKLREARIPRRMSELQPPNPKPQHESRKCKTRLNHSFPRERRLLHHENGVAKLCEGGRRRAEGGEGGEGGEAPARSDSTELGQ
jgi:hypothetical protein